MPEAQPNFREASIWSQPIRDLGLTIAGTRLEPILAEFQSELEQVGLRKLRPRFYLSTEWGVPMDTIAIALPFYLARPDLTELHAQRTGHVEGVSRADILRYLRHEMGHVVGYAHRLYDRSDWVNQFGSITQPYLEDYRPQPFSRRFVRHLPGWYAQKHPDEDWAETFAVWMTPGVDWRADYAGWPDALAKLEYTERVIAELADVDPIQTDDQPDEDVGELDYSLEEFYQDLDGAAEELPQGLDGALRAIFADLAGDSGPRAPAGDLMRRLERDVVANVFVWTGHFPEKTRALVHHLAVRADALGLAYPNNRDGEVVVAVTTLVTALAMNHVHHGSYLP
jgi:hypothetical protein